jgi:zinc protease
MKKIFSIISLFLLLCVATQAQEDFRKQAPAPGPAPKIQMGDYEQFQLPNGLKIIVVENRKLPRVSFELFVDVPPTKEGDIAGAADMAGQLLKTGTTTKTKAQIDEAVDFIGASLSTSANGMRGTALTRHRDKLLEIMADILYNPAFPQDEFEKLKKQTLSGLASNKDNPNAIANNVARVMRYGKNHPYGELTTEATVENIKLEDCKKYYQTYFKPNISYLVIVGDITPANAKALAEKYFGKWQRGDVKSETFEKPSKPGMAKVDFVNKTGAVQSVINITYPVDMRPGAPDVIKASVANTLLGGFFSSRLNANIREDKGYSYGVYAQLSPDREIGFFNAGGSVRNEVTDSALIEFLYEMKRLGEQRVPDSEMDLVKSVMTGNFARSLEQPATVARYALNTARYNLPEDYYPTYLERLSKVSADDVMEMAKKYITPDNAHIVIVGNKDATADKLTRFATNNKVDFYDYYGNKIEISSATVPVGLTAEQVIENYLAAIGGRDKLATVQDIKIKMSTVVQGMSLESIMQQKAPNKLSMSVMMGGMAMQEQKYDGKKGLISQMGQKQVLEGKDLESMKEEALLFPESHFKKMGYKLTLKGLDQVEGKKAYQVEAESPAGIKKTYYFDVETGLKIRSISVLEAAGNSTSIMNDYADYKEVDGIKIPYTVTVIGAAPFPLKSEVTSVEINKGIQDTIFAVE